MTLRNIRVLIASAAVVIGSAPFSYALPPKDPIQVRIWKNVMVPMRDGVRLATDVLSAQRRDHPSRSLPHHPHPAPLREAQDGHDRRVLHHPRLRGGDPGHAGPVRIGGGILHLRQRGRGRVRRSGMDRRPTLVHRRRGDLRRILRGRLPERPGGPESAPPEDHVRLRGHLQLHRGRSGPRRRLRPLA